jgi:hypothetical protein
LLFAVDVGRSITGPAVMDIRPTSVQIITRVWSEGFVGPPGYPVDGPIVTLPNYTKVREVTQREVAESAGLFEMGDIRIGRITPVYTHPDGSIRGFTEQQLAPDITDQGTEVIYRVSLQSGSSGISGDYARVQLIRDHTLHMVLIVRRLLTTASPLAAGNP